MSPPPAGPRRTVLLVEDSIDEVFMVRAFLDKAGAFQIATAQDGQSAARMITERMYDLYITDLNLPGMDGYDLIRLIRARQPTVPVLAVTGYTANHYIEGAYRAGANHVLIKPLDRDEFVKRVNEALSGGEAAAEAKLPVVLAIGAVPGDAEAGCGGTLLASREAGHSVLLVPLSLRTATGDSALEPQRKSAELMGARTISTDAAASKNPSEHQMLLERIVRELKPVTALIPSLADDLPARREAHRLSRAVLTDVPDVLAYETATSSVEFRPDRFVDVAAHMAKKLEVLAAYRELSRPDLEAGYVRSVARHWGRRLAFGEVEAFEVLRDQGEDAG